jgi:uncharacterized protein YkwD
MHPRKVADKIGRRLHGKINEERRKRGLKTLKGRKPLISAATDHSRVMAREGRLFHDGPDGSPQSRAPARYNRVAENCAKVHEHRSTGKAAGQLLSKWLNSPDHRAHMLYGKYRYGGLGIYVKGAWVYATHFMAMQEVSSRDKTSSRGGTVLGKLFG